ncbi:MAG: hypothetical protein ACRDCZ_00950 [Culicoidibacterales bacterium]
MRIPLFHTTDIHSHTLLDQGSISQLQPDLATQLASFFDTLLPNLKNPILIDTADFLQGSPTIVLDEHELDYALHIFTNLLSPLASVFDYQKNR